MGPKAEADVVQIIGDIKRRHRVRRVFICGGSMGGSSALTFTTLHPELVDGVVCLNGTTNHVEYDQFQDAIAESFGGTKKECPREYKNRSAEFWPERFNMPVAITAGGKDNLVPAASSVRLAENLKALGRPVLLIFREDCGHCTNYDDTKSAFEFVLNNAKQK
jgi:pimeloyl-ACP methyl ester carboxylesterase